MLIGVVAPAFAQAAGDAANLAFVHIGVIDVESGRSLPDHTVIVAGRTISAVGPSTKVRIPEGFTVIDGRGLFLAPGFADMHVHLYTEGDAFTYLANGITTVRNMAGDASHLEFKRKTAAGEMIGPRIITAGPVIETRLSHPDNALISTPEDARKEVARQHAAGFDFIKIYNDISPETYVAVIGAARELKMPVVGHVPDAIGLRGAISARQRSIEHLRGYPYELLQPSVRDRAKHAEFDVRTLAWNSVKAKDMKRLADETAAAGIWNCPTFTFTVHELSPAIEHAALLARPETQWLSLSGLPKDRTKGYLSGFSEDDFTAAQAGLKNQFRLVRALDAAGAGLLVGTDSWLSGYAFADEVELLVQAGLSPARVLRMATLDSAKFLNENNEAGSIAAGKRADLVVLKANPLAYVGNVRRVAGVLSGGKYFDEKFLEAYIKAIKAKRADEN